MRQGVKLRSGANGDRGFLATFLLISFPFLRSDVHASWLGEHAAGEIEHGPPQLNFSYGGKLDRKNGSRLSLSLKRRALGRCEARNSLAIERTSEPALHR